MVTANVFFVLLPMLSFSEGSQHESTDRNCLSRGCTQCTPGYFGPDCKKMCVDCNDRGCDVISGLCHYCKTGLYGTNCSHRCPVNCFSDQGDTRPPCERYTGRCTIGCKGNMCSPKCDQQCPSNCLPGTCYFANCKCTCKTGFFGPECACKKRSPRKTNTITPTSCFWLAWFGIVLTIVFCCVLCCLAHKADILPLRFGRKNYMRVKTRGAKYQSLPNPSDLSDDSMENLFRSLPTNESAPPFDQQKDFCKFTKFCTGHGVTITDGSLNASFIKGFDGREENRYICAEEPVPKTTEAFWSMVKQYKCKCIVLISNRKKIGPFGGNSSVTGVESEPFSQPMENTYRWRKFGVETHEGKHQLHLFNYFAWSRDNPAFRKFLSFVRSKPTFKDRSSPVVVLSTDGESAAHVFIALDYILDSVESKAEITLPQCVKNLVLHRKGMFHNIAQLRKLRDYYKMVFRKNEDPLSSGTSEKDLSNDLPLTCTNLKVVFWILLIIFVLSLVIAFIVSLFYSLS